MADGTHKTVEDDLITDAVMVRYSAHFSDENSGSFVELSGETADIVFFC